MKNIKKRFVVTYKQGNEFKGKIMIMVDLKTGVNYMLTNICGSESITPLLDETGKPVVTPDVMINDSFEDLNI